MTANATNPLTYNGYIQALGALAVEEVDTSQLVYVCLSEPFQALIPQALNYAELRIQRDIDFLQARSSTIYDLVAGKPVFPIPINDFMIVETIEVVQLDGDGTLIDSAPMSPVSREFIQNCYSGIGNSGVPRYFAMYGDQFGGDYNTSVNVLMGPPPAVGWSIQVNGVVRLPSLAKFNTTPAAANSLTYISQYMPDVLLMASMIFVSGYQRNFSSNSDSPDMPVNYEKQYQALMRGAVTEDNRRKFMASAWTAYAAPPAASPNR